MHPCRGGSRTTRCFAEESGAPGNPNKLIAAMWEHRRWPWFFQSGGPGSGLYITSDAGNNWKKLTDKDGLPNGELGRIGIAFAGKKDQKQNSESKKTAASPDTAAAPADKDNKAGKKKLEIEILDKDGNVVEKIKTKPQKGINRNYWYLKENKMNLRERARDIAGFS